MMIPIPNNIRHTYVVGNVLKSNIRLEGQEAEKV